MQQASVSKTLQLDSHISVTRKFPNVTVADYLLYGFVPCILGSVDWLTLCAIREQKSHQAVLISAPAFNIHRLLIKKQLSSISEIINYHLKVKRK